MRTLTSLVISPQYHLAFATYSHDCQLSLSSKDPIHMREKRQTQSGGRAMQKCSTVEFPRVIDFLSVLTRQYTASFIKATYAGYPENNIP